MKRRELEKMLRHTGCYLKREGGSHSLWINSRTGAVEAIPRHSEVKEPLARKILKTWDDLMYRIYVRQKIDAGLADFRAGRVHTHKSIRKEFGLA